jgi:hypothetical protein
MADKTVYEDAIVIMGESINQAEIEIESLENKTSLLEKELSADNKERINKVYHTKKSEKQNDTSSTSSNVRIMRRLNKTLAVSKEITDGTNK